MRGINGLKVLLFFCVMVGLLFACNPVSAAEITATPDQSLQAIVNRAQSGDVIKLTKGRYEGAITIGKSITLVGELGVVIDGRQKGNVITIAADRVTIKGLTIQNSGTGKNESGIYLKSGRNHLIEDNTFSNTMFGIYIDQGTDHKINRNTIKSYTGHFSKRGSGIHVFQGENHVIEENTISSVQDGVYLDNTKNIMLIGNQVFSSRYGFHFMFSEEVLIKGNLLKSNITGLMVMDSAKIDFISNQVLNHFHVRGFGVLVYDSEDITIDKNEIKQNSTGLSLEETVDVDIYKNIIAGNQLGLEFIGENANNIFSENNFIGNVVQSKISNNKMKLDNGERGNYWDDYSSFDVTGDGIGEITYKAGSLYDQLLNKEPYWQFFFESPSIKLWSKAETLFPSIGVADVYDENPLVAPVQLSQDQKENRKGRNIGALFLALPFLWFSIMVLWFGRRL